METFLRDSRDRINFLIDYSGRVSRLASQLAIRGEPNKAEHARWSLGLGEKFINFLSLMLSGGEFACSPRDSDRS
jgi:hypothetical protein